MKFFKHFTDAHEGTSMQSLLEIDGFSAVGRYWFLVEMCAAKMDKGASEEFTKEHCKFRFTLGYLSKRLGFGNRHQCLTYLGRLSDLGLCSIERDGDVVATSMPKLLESLDRDSRRARTERAESAPKNKIKNKDKDKDKKESLNIFNASLQFENIKKFNYTALFEKYPRYQKKSESLGLMATHIDTQEKYDLLERQIKNYSDFCVREKFEPKYTLTFPGWWNERFDWSEPNNQTKQKQPLEISWTKEQA